MPTHENDWSAMTATRLWGERVQAFSTHAAFQFCHGEVWECLTWAQADTAAREIAAGLCSLGVDRGQRVALLCQTRLEWVLCDIAIAMAGLVSVPVYPSSTVAQCDYLITDSGASVAIVENAEQVAKLVPLLDRSQGFRIVSVEAMAPDAHRAHGLLSLEELRRAGVAWGKANPGEIDRRADSVKPADAFTIIYTSGTTGKPKGVVLTHANLLASCASGVRAFDIRPTDVQYLFLPLAHVLGREVEWAPIIVGSQIAFSRGLAQIKYDLTTVRPTFMAGVPRIFEKLYAAVLSGAKQGSRVKRALVRWAFGVAAQYSSAVRVGKPVPRTLRLSYRLADKLVLCKLRRRLGLDRCRFLISGGAPLSAEIAEFFHGAGLLILEGYGLTETVAAAFVNRWNNYRFGTVGQAVDVIESKVAPDGEILLRGPSIFSSYYGDEEATKEAFDSEGWFRTGDIGVLEEGFLRIVDRKKDIIITAGGKNVAPQKLENALKAHTPLVSQVVVFGDRRSYCVALITPSEPAAREYGGGEMAAAAASIELRAAVEKSLAEVNATLASYETIKSFAILPADFSEATGELTPSLKVKRDVVASKFANVLDGLYGSGSVE